MKKIPIFLIISVLLIQAVFCQEIVMPRFDLSSISSKPKDLTDKEKVEKLLMKELIGFPYDTDGLDERVVNLINRASDVHILKKEILKLYWDGKLEKNIRQKTFADIINACSNQTTPLKIQCRTDLTTIISTYPDVEIPKLMAVFLLAGKFGSLDNLIPYLEYSLVSYGKDILAGGYELTSNGEVIELSEIDTTLLPAKNRLEFWPAANAILKNREISMPKLITIIKDKSAREALRLRAVAFINTMDPTMLDKKNFEELEPSILDSIIYIKEKKLKWRTVVLDIAKQKQSKEINEKILKNKFKNQSLTDVLSFFEKEDKRFWGDY